LLKFFEGFVAYLVLQYLKN